MSKMFVHYSGTVAAFKAAEVGGVKLSDKYINHIVFIKGGDKGAGAIYTHGKYFADADALKYFSKVSDGVTVAEAAGPNGTLTFTANDPALLAVDASAKGVTISLSDAFVNKVNNTATALGAATDAANSSGSAYARIAQLQSDIQSLTGGNGSISEQINNAINALDVDAKAGDFVASVKQVDGKIEATMGSFNFDEAGAAAAVQGNLDTEVARAKAAEEANAKAIAAEKARMDAFMLDADVKDTAVDTLKEIQAYITSDGAAAQEMLDAIEAAQGAADAAQDEVDALEGVVAGVKATAEAAATKAALEAEASRADAAEKANAAAIKAISDDYLKGADKTALEGQISAEASAARAAEKANADAIAAIKADYLKASDKNALQNAIDAKVAQSAYDAKVAELEGFWAWEEL